MAGPNYTVIPNDWQNLEYIIADLSHRIINEDTSFSDYILADGSRVYTSDGAGFKDEDTMNSDSAVATASQQSVKAYVDNSFSAAIGTVEDTGVCYVDSDEKIVTDVTNLSWNYSTNTLTTVNLTVSGLTATRIPYAGTGGLLSDSANLTWDNTNKCQTITGTTGKQLRLAYDVAEYCDFTLNSSGYLSIVPAGARCTITGDFIVEGDTTLEDNVSIGDTLSVTTEIDIGTYVIADSRITSSGDIELKLGDNAGSNKVSILDNEPNEVAYIDSLGNLGLDGKIIIGSFGSPRDVTATREYGIEAHYSGNNYNCTAIRARASAVTTDSSAQIQGGLFQAANNDDINVAVLNGFLAEAIGKADTNAATIAMMRAGIVNAEWSAKDTVTDLRTFHIRTHTRNAATEGYISNTGYGLYIENEAVGGNGQALDAGIYLKGTNLSGGNNAYIYGLDFTGATYTTANIRLSTGGKIVGNDGVIDFDNDDVTSTGSGIFGNLDVDTLNLNDNAITDSTGTISLDDDNLESTGKAKFNNFYTTNAVAPTVSDSCAFGGYCDASGTVAFTAGYYAVASSSYSLAIGTRCEAKTNESAIIIGAKPSLTGTFESSGAGSINIGYCDGSGRTPGSQTSSGTGSLVVAVTQTGNTSQASAATSVAIGINVQATAASAIAIGYGLTNNTATSLMFGVSHNDLHFTSSAIILNEDATDLDVRMEGTGSINCFYLDYGNANITINGTAVSANYDLGLVGDGVLCLKETSTPTADTNYGKLYCKNDDKIYFQDGAGSEHTLAYAEAQSGCIVHRNAVDQTGGAATVAFKIEFTTEDYDFGSEFDHSLVTGTADATEANKLHDDDAGFTSDLVGATVWNTTDDTYAEVTAFVDSGELTIDTDIMVNGETYRVYHSKFTPTTAGYYLVNLNVTYTDIANANYAEVRIQKNGSDVAVNTILVGATGYNTVDVAKIIYCDGSTDYIEGFGRTQASNRTVLGTAYATYMDIIKLNS